MESLNKEVQVWGILLSIYSFSDVFCFLPLQIFPPQPRYYWVKSLFLRGGLSPPPHVHTKLRIVQVHRALLLHFISFQVSSFYTRWFFLFFFFSRMFTGSTIDCKAAPYSTLFLRALCIFLKLFKGILTRLLYVPLLSMFFCTMVKFSHFHF